MRFTTLCPTCCGAGIIGPVSWTYAATAESLPVSEIQQNAERTCKTCEGSGVVLADLIGPAKAEMVASVLDTATVSISAIGDAVERLYAERAE
jgi:hypothetical protein